MSATPAGARVAIAVVLAAGVVAAFHVGKLPPALPAIRDELGIGLVTAGWLVSLMQLAGATLALAGGAIADRIGPRRAMTIGLVLLAGGGLLGATAPGAGWLLVSRAVESAGLTLTVLPGPALLARLAPAASLRFVMGLWGAYMPFGMALAILGGSLGAGLAGWRAIWIVCAVLAVCMALVVRLAVPAPVASGAAAASTRTVVGEVLRSPGAWLLAGCFGFYAAQWMSLFSFLPTLYRDEGVPLSVAGPLTALGVAMNVVGNVAAGWLLQRGVPRARLVALAAVVMGAGAWLALGSGAPFALRFAAVLAFSVAGGLLPGTLFAAGPADAPHARAVSTTAGLMQQGSSLGQILAPPMLAALAAHRGGWKDGWWLTGGFALADLLFAWLIARRDRRAVQRRASVPTSS